MGMLCWRASRTLLVFAAISLTVFLWGEIMVSAGPPTPGAPFLYQGQLIDGGTAANGSYDFEFSLWDAATGGMQTGSTAAVNALEVADGIIEAELDFGDVFDGSALWLQIAVRSAAPRGAAFTTLAPRRPILPAPQAYYANVAGSAINDSTEDADADPANELNTALELQGTQLALEDAGGTITVELASLQDGVTDPDADPANELNTGLLLDGTNLQLEDAGGTLSADLSALQDGVEDADPDPANELNAALVLDGTELALADAGGTITVELASLQDGVTDPDADPTNELNISLSLDGTELALEDAGGSITVELAGLQDGVTDPDADPTNELNAALELQGTQLALADAGGTITVELASLQDGVTDPDSDPANELQTISRAGSDVTLSDGGGSVSINDDDADAANELNAVLELQGTQLALEDAGGTITVELASLQDGVTDPDADPTNELQSIARTGDTVTLSDGGGSFTVDDDDATTTNELNTSFELVGTSLRLTDVGTNTLAVDLGPLAGGEFGDGHSLDAVDGSPTDLLFVGPTGRVEIAVDNPGQLPASLAFAARDIIGTTNSIFQHITLHGNFAYVTWGDVLGGTGTPGMLTIYDVSDPANIVQRGSFGTGMQTPNATRIIGSLAYVTDFVANTLHILDISDPDNIQFVNSLTRFQARNVFFDQARNLAILLHRQGSGTLEIFDITDPANPVSLDSTTTNLLQSQVMARSGHFVYVAANFQGDQHLAVFDISDPSNIVARDTISTNIDSPTGIDAVGNFVYVSDIQADRVTVYDASDPDNLVARGEYVIPSPSGIAVEDGLLYVMDFSPTQRLIALDVTDPDNPVEVFSTTQNIGTPETLDVLNGLIATTDESLNHLALFELEGAERLLIGEGDVNVADGNLSIRVGRLGIGSGAAPSALIDLTGTPGADGIEFPDGTLQTTAFVGDVDDADADPANELQTISRNGTNITLSDGGGTVSIEDNDPSATNELNTAFALNGTTLQLTDAGGTRNVNLSSLQAGGGSVIPSPFIVNKTDSGPDDIARFQLNGTDQVTVSDLGALRVGSAADLYRVDFREANTSSNVIHFEREADSVASADLLELKMGAGSSDTSQFIEMERGGDVKLRVHGNGDLTSDGTISSPADFAEMIAVKESVKSVEPGDVMVIDTDNLRTVTKSTTARSTLVAGVYSTKPGLLGSEHDWDAMERDMKRSKALASGRSIESVNLDEGPGMTSLELGRMIGEVPVAVVGIVPCKVSAENGPIRPGDLLVTSATAGHAMRDDTPRPGTVVGKSLGTLSTGTGTIRVLVTLH